MADDPAPLSPERNTDAQLAAADDDTLAAIWLGDDVPRAREELPAIAAPQVSESDGPAVVQTVEEHKSDEPADSEQERVPPPVDESEVYFLIADFLKRRSVCLKAADVLIQELAEHQLLKGGVDWTGKPRAAAYEDYRLRHRDISSSHLVQLLQGASASFPRLNGKKEVDDKVKDAPIEENRSLLLKARVKTQLQLSVEERKKLAKEIVNQLLKVRAVLKTLRVVEKVIRKYERYHKYMTASRVEELPPELQLMLTGDRKTDAGTDKVTTLAADVRALKQLFQLRQERAEVEKQVEMLMQRAKQSGLFQTTARTGRNQASLLRRREIRWQHDTQLPPAYVYSRIRRLKTLSGHLQIQAYCLAYDKLGKVVITGSDDRLVKIWSLRTGDLLFTLRGHVGNITDLAVNHSNTLLASSSDDKTVRVWEISTGAPVAVLVGHSSVVNAVRFHPKKNIIVTASDDGRCFCYKVPEIPLMDQPETKIETARRLYSLNAYMLSLHPIYSMKHARREGVRSCKVHCVTFSRCGDFVASGGHDGIARVWDLSMVSAPDAPAVVPRYQPTDEPQEARAPEQQLGGNGPQIPPVTVPVIPAPVAQALNPALGNLQTPLVQQTMSQVDGVAASVIGEPFRAVAPPQPLDPVQPFQPQAQLQAPGPLPLQVPAQTLVPDQQLLLPQEPLLLRPQAPLQPQTGPDVPLPTVAEALQRETAPRPTQPPQVQNDLPSLSLSDDAVPSIEPIALLKGHKGPVSSIAYNHRGDRIVTASIKDSTARVWKWKRKYKSLFGAVLLAKESSAEYDEISAMYGVRGRKKPTPVVDMVAWTHDDKRLITLHSVKLNSESADPTWEQRIRIWDPESGKLLMTLGAIDKEKKNGHVNAAFALSTHPTDWRIVVTAGYDGRVFLWDISSGRMLKSFTNLSPDSKPLSNLDGGFTPDGSGFCFTDQIGRLLIFGTGTGEQYAATPVQQYFLHDYVMLVTDGHYNVRDRETQELPSLMDSGPLMDASLVQYPHQPPHLLPDKLFTSEEYAENRRLRIQQSKESEIQCGVHHLPEAEEDIQSFPLAIVKSEEKKSSQGQTSFAADAMALARASYRLNGAPVMLSELRRRGSGSRRYADHRRRRERPAEERDTSVLELEISSEDDRSDEDFQVPTPRHAAEEEEDEEDEDEEELDLDEDDLLSDNEEAVIYPANSRRRRLRSTPARGGRRLQSESEEEQEDAPRQLRTRRNAARRSRLVLDSDAEEEGEIPGDEQSDAGGEREARNRDDSAEVVVESNDGVIMGDNQRDRFDDSMSYTQMLEAKRAQLGAAPIPAENTDDALIPCAFCGVGNDDGMLKLPGDGMGVHPLIFGVQRVFVHDQCAIASPLCFNRDGNWYNVTREIRRGRSLSCVACTKRGATIGCTISACRNSYHWKCAINLGWSVDQMHFFCPAHQSRPLQRNRHEETCQSAAEDGGAIIEPASKRFGLKFHREWLQLVSLRSIHQYVPQVGDYVVYLPEGHPGYLHYGGMPHPRYYERLSKFYAVKCRVVDIKYVFPTAEEHARCSIIKCELLLAVLAVPTSAVRSSGENEEQKQEEETKEDVADTAGLFNPESSPFAEFTSVDEALTPAASEPSTRFNFKVLYHSNDVANFLVLDHIYESGVCGNWRVGDRVQMPYVQLNDHGLEEEAKMSYGTVDSILRKPFATSNSGEITPWECVKINWDAPDDEICAVCPWELEAASPEERREKRVLSLRRRSTRLFFSRYIIGEKCEALLQEMDQVLTLSISRDFMYPVDEDTFMDYSTMVANPIDLTKIQQRLRLGYYRQVEAFLADVKLLSVNCETYNIPSSAISQNSRNLVSAVLTQAQRHFPHLLNRREADGERASMSYSYPPDDFLTNFSEDPEETQLALLEVELLIPTSVDTSSNASAVAGQVDAAPAVAAPASSDVQETSPLRRSRRHTRSNETADNVAAEEKVDHVVEEQIETTVNTAPSQAQSTSNGVDTAVFNSPRQLLKREVPEPQLLSPRTRRATRVVTTPSTNNGGSARKRQRRSADQELLTYSALMDKYSVKNRELIERACKEDLRSVLMIFHEALTETDKEDIFAAPVTDDFAPRYSEIIPRPMDFGTINDKLYKYRSFRDYFAHVELVFSNAITYNGWHSFIGGLVEDLQKYCVKFLLDAAGANLRGMKNPSTKKAARSTDKTSTSKLPGKQRARQKPAAVSEDEEDSWSSSSSESEEDDDEEEDESLTDESDYDVGRKRRLRRPAPKSKKKAKRRY
ncbi:hypothetical protein PPTG_13318 [Phytophthora nicotianae INRA-310]|uniref:Bromodomain and WD repeat-containing protein 1 n=2 Tax=Phytophthora nicotianae (strain INRA-310) TaxID=761204 RepID=W2Q4E5_PHYN3|nr:hypothetical protein PPTG_13318 [Phytophthora nicotianae INRA-310]ETN07404.1 hypothetical protein PPTG_13318 [Phytophthora nicotianae INRA-310]